MTNVSREFSDSSLKYADGFTSLHSSGVPLMERVHVRYVTDSGQWSKLRKGNEL